MIKIEKIETGGWEAAIRGMRNPMNSWDKSDSYWADDDLGHFYQIGPNDLKLMKQLAGAGSDHRKYLRMISVSMDINAPLYWWKEYDTYKVGTVANSCSTMHKIHSKEFTLDDFSCEHLNSVSRSFMEQTITCMNLMRDAFLRTNDKIYWWQVIQLLPTSYNQKRTCTLNYENLANMYFSRKNHKLDEWHIFCDTIEKLPYFKELFKEV